MASPVSVEANLDAHELPAGSRLHSAEHCVSRFNSLPPCCAHGGDSCLNSDVAGRDKGGGNYLTYDTEENFGNRCEECTSFPASICEIAVPGEAPIDQPDIQSDQQPLGLPSADCMASAIGPAKSSCRYGVRGASEGTRSTASVCLYGSDQFTTPAQMAAFKNKFSAEAPPGASWDTAAYIGPYNAMMHSYCTQVTGSGPNAVPNYLRQNPEDPEQTCLSWYNALPGKSDDQTAITKQSIATELCSGDGPASQGAACNKSPSTPGQGHNCTTDIDCPLGSWCMNDPTKKKPYVCH